MEESGALMMMRNREGHEEEEMRTNEGGGGGVRGDAMEDNRSGGGGGGLELFMEATGCDEEEAARFMERHASVDAAVDAYFSGEEIDREQRRLYEEEMVMEQMEMDAPPSASRGRSRPSNDNDDEDDMTNNGGGGGDNDGDGDGDGDEERERRRRRRRRQRTEANGTESTTGAIAWGRRVLSRVKRVLAGDGGPSNTAWLMKMQDTMGLGHPAFLDCSFRQALARSSRDQRLLVVYLHSEYHELSESFCHRVWYDPFILDYFTDAGSADGGGGGGGENAPLLWAGDVRTNEAYHLFSSLRGSTFPLVACMIAERAGSGARLVRAIEGEMACDIVKLARMLEECAEGVAAQAVVQRRDRDEYQRARELREEQDQEYERSLAEDIARAERRREEERLERERIEEEAAREAQILERQRSREERRASKEREIFTRRESAGSLLPPEPESGSKGVTTIRINLPNGVKQMRRFGPDARLRNVFDWVASLEDCTFIDFNLVSNFPRVIYTDARKDETLAEAGLSPQSALFVEVQDEEEEEEEEDEDDAGGQGEQVQQ